jgi:hypothetical protein
VAFSVLKGEITVGYKVKLQKISRPTNNTFFVTVPVVLVDSMELEKGEEFEWLLEDKNTLVLQRKVPKPKREIPQ